MSSHLSLEELGRVTRDLHPDIATEVAELEVLTAVEEENSDSSLGSEVAFAFKETSFYQKHILKSPWGFGVLGFWGFGNISFLTTF